MGNKKNKRKASSPAESHRPAPSRPVSPVYQAANRCDTPDQGYTDFQHAMEHCGDDSSEEPYIPEEGDDVFDESHTAQVCEAFLELAYTIEPTPPLVCQAFGALLERLTTSDPNFLKYRLESNQIVQTLIAEAISKAKAPATPLPPPPPTMEVDSPTTPKASGPPDATPPPRGNSTPPPAPQSGAPASATPPTPPAAPAPHGKPAPLRIPPAKRAPKHAPPPPPSQPAPKPTYAAALGSKAPRPRNERG
ncbi:hypothetical protein H0H81_008072 [Sphagnurus paluster]|uniref:Uncharacterized protein n=1 Tax=Sphagnurus paluster TaxID=117069 RepID=A0A9P7GRC5_9AGAR|nr:hypothetical protein H0H81_008072 [Sphagnurus paluster]